MRNCVAVFFAFALLCGGSRIVLAHAFLQRAAPAVGSSVATAPSEVKLWFTEDLEPAFSSATLADGAGGAITTAASHIDATDRKLLVLPLPPLKPGTYKVTWRVVSVDTHATNGDFIFKVAGN